MSSPRALPKPHRRLAAVGAALALLVTPLAVIAGPAQADPVRAPKAAASGCDPIDPANCLLPFPNDHYTVRDHRTATGRRVNLTPAMMPANVAGTPVDPTEPNRNDGFSPGSMLLTVVPGVDLGTTGAAPQTDMARSLRRDAPIALIDTRTGRRWPYWAELDSGVTDPAKRALIIRPAKDLAEGHHYVVALRNLRDSSGAPIAANPAFAAMLADRPPADATLRGRWYSMRPVLRQLRRAGIGTRGLNLAWDFTVASTRNITGRAVHMRDDAFRKLGGKSPAVTVTKVTDYTEAQNPRLARRVEGTIEVPSYLDTPGGPPGSRLNYGADGQPAQKPGQVLNVPFQCDIPHAAFGGPARPVLFGHGLFGDQTSVGGTDAAAQAHDSVFCGATFTGMSSGDLLWLLSMSQDFSTFPSVPDRLQQSYVDFLYLGRAMIHPDGLAAQTAFHDANGKPLLDRTAKLTYTGYSLGGIEGTALTALGQDFRRSLLGVPGVNFSTLLNRSVLFTVFQQVIDKSYPDRTQQQIILALAQMLWDRGEGDGYVQHVVRDPLPGTPVHQVLLHEAFGDHQVTNIGTEVEARTLGVGVHWPAVQPGRSLDTTPFWGIPRVTSRAHRGSELVMWDSGSPPDPIGNIPATAGHDPHNDPPNNPVAVDQAATFLRTGIVQDVCAGAPCTGPQAP
ncbi:MAG TPA: hypothetical protein VGL93_01780 [Streptosporangiaceae bacterium]